MTDIVERLRNATQFMDLDELAHEAADEIERLRKDVQNLNKDCMMLAADLKMVET